MKKTKAVRKHLLELLEGNQAHADFDAAIKGLPVKLRGVVPTGAEHSAWQLLEHMRIAQQDILEFSRNPKHVSPAWPEGYWPKTARPPSGKAWEESVKSFRSDLEAMKKLVAKKDSDLFAPIS